MGGGDQPDRSVEVAQLEQQARREEREAAAAKEARELADFESRLSGAYGSGIENAKRHFSSRGLNADDYVGDITTAANAAKSSVPRLDSNPGAYFADLGARIFDEKQTAQRAKAQRDIDSFAPSGFATRRITSDSDDAIIDAILAEQEQTAGQYIRNLLDRGVVTNTGFEAANKNLQGQRAGAKSRVSEIGNQILNQGRGNVENLASTARQAADKVQLGQQFDPFSYQQDINNEFTTFFNTLGDQLRGRAPSDLFTTTGLAGIAGAAQGAQNTAFNPAALAGVDDDDDDDDNNSFNPF